MKLIPEYAYFVLDRIKNQGKEAYIVGGAVRDLYLNREIKDIDINTNLLPDQIKELFSDCTLSTKGEKHGTITIIVGSKRNRVEVTTYRIDGEYSDSRHPDYIDFNADLVKDLSRRDFTMNSICYDGYDTFIDVFDAKKDIDNKIIRVIGDGNKRFEEDALRIMRGFRFVAQLGFELDGDTKKAMTENKERLGNITVPRINLEFFDIVRGEHSWRGVKAMLECGVFTEYISNLSPTELESYSKAKSFHLKLFLLMRNTYNKQDNIISIGKKRAIVFNWLEENILKYPNGLPTNKNDIKNIIHNNGAKNVIRLAEYFVINNIQHEDILNIIDEVRYNWSSYGNSQYNSSVGNLSVINLNQYIEYNNEDLAVTKDILLSKTTVTPEYVDIVYDYLFHCVRCKNFINERNELISRANIKMDKLLLAKVVIK